MYILCVYIKSKLMMQSKFDTEFKELMVVNQNILLNDRNVLDQIELKNSQSTTSC